MEPSGLQAGDVVQLNPKLVGNPAFAGCMLVVTEPKAFGCQGYVQALGDSRESRGGQAFYRAKWAEMEYVGRAVWSIE
jgi:hypothetical protein